MILSGKEILIKIKSGELSIDPFDERRINSNSYNLRLHNELLVYTDDILDMKKPLNTKKILIPNDGFILQPRILYLGRTFERTETHCAVPMLEGRTSVGRLLFHISINGTVQPRILQ